MQKIQQSTGQSKQLPLLTRELKLDLSALGKQNFGNFKNAAREREKVTSQQKNNKRRKISPSAND